MQFLLAENQVLRSRLGERVRATPQERARLVRLSASFPLAPIRAGGTNTWYGRRKSGSSVAGYLDGLTIKPSTEKNYEAARHYLEKHFGKDRQITAITPSDEAVLAGVDVSAAAARHRLCQGEPNGSRVTSPLLGAGLAVNHRHSKRFTAAAAGTSRVLHRQRARRTVIPGARARARLGRPSHPLEEAATFQQAFDRGYNVKALSARLGKSVQYIARRASLTQLSKAWRAEIQRPDSDAGRLSVAHLELIARLPEETQAILADNGFSPVFGRGFPTVEELKRVIDGGLHSLRAMPWKVDDEALDPKAGACLNCPKRSGMHPMLFEAEALPRTGRSPRRTDASTRRVSTASGPLMFFAARRTRDGSTSAYGSCRSVWAA